MSNSHPMFKSQSTGDSKCAVTALQFSRSMYLRHSVRSLQIPLELLPVHRAISQFSCISSSLKVMPNPAFNTDSAKARSRLTLRFTLGIHKTYPVGL